MAGSFSVVVVGVKAGLLVARTVVFVLLFCRCYDIKL